MDREPLTAKFRGSTVCVCGWLAAGARVLVGFFFLGLGGIAFAQTIDSLEWVVDGPARAVARITFNTNVRFLRQAPISNSDTVQISFEFNSNDESISGQTFEEGKRLVKAGNKPDILLSYFPAPTVRPKLLMLRFDQKVHVLARQGPDPRTIDLIFGAGFIGGGSSFVLPKMAETAGDRRFALLLQTSSIGDQTAAPRIPADFQDYAVFSYPVNENGIQKNGVAVGYFKNQRDAEILREMALSQFPTARVIDLAAEAALLAGGPPVSGTTMPPAGAVAPQSIVLPTTVEQYAVQLKKFAADDLAATPRIPVEFQDYSVFTRSSEENGAKHITLSLGYFRTRQEAEAVRLRALNRFPSASVIALVAALAPIAPKSESAQAPTLTQTVPQRTPIVEQSKEIPLKPNGSPVIATGSASVEVRDKAGGLLAKGHRAFDERRYQDAVDVLNQVLMLPPNPSSQDAQELIGFAWEGLNLPAKARVEYQLYLKLYPQSEHAAKVAQRLEALGGKSATARAGDRQDEEPKSRYSYTGSVSQYYYGGQTKTESLVNIAAGIDQNTLSKTNQSSLVTSVDLSGRYKSDESDIKLVLRDTVSNNFIATSTSQSVLSAAYLDYRSLGSHMGLRVGRQSAIGGSLFGLFDGVSFTMPVANQYKLSASLGVPANTLISAPAQRLAGVMLEADSLFEHWGGNLSLIDQTTEGISDRRAMGLEVRYFGESLSLFSQLDYDLNFNALNAATLQSSMQGPFGTTITMLVDDRKAPSLQLSDALISSGTTSLKTLLQLRSLAEVQGLAMDTTARAKQALFSVSRALTPRWQGSMDFRYSDVGALPAVGNFQAMPATGPQYNFSMQLTGSNLYSERDINGFNVSVLSSDTLRGTQIAYNNLTGFMGNRLSVEPSIRLYTQTDNTAAKVQRISPGLRLSYKVSERASLLGETIYELSHTEGPTGRDDSSSYFFYMGYRYDFFH